MQTNVNPKMRHSLPDSELKQELKSILNSFSNSEIEELSSFLDYREWPTDAAVMNEGKKCNFMGFLLKGRLALKKETSFHGRHILLAILEKGATVGEFSMIDQTLPTATVTALEDSGLLTLTSDRMDDLVETNPALGVKLLRHVLSVMNKKYQNAVNRLSKIL
ncbi:MAG: cyclic nucleotide-binding domain-containing protein [Thermodesulfobacteriota bacterium]|nr:cyclic nucleotide-binding domain-containing protein [Thermodesulfobacteriota bacterium]